MNKKKIGWVTAGMIIVLALIFDAIQIFLTLTVIGTVFSWFVSGLAWIIFLVWFMLLGVSYFDKGGAVRLLTVFASVITELLPLINALPGLTIGVTALIVQHNLTVSAQAKHLGRPTDTAKMARKLGLARIRQARVARGAAARPGDAQQ